MIYICLLNLKFIIMASKKFSIDCFKVDNSIDKVIVNKCYNCNLSVGDMFYQVYIPDSDIPNCSVSCFTFLSFEDALYFVRKKFVL